MAYPKLVGSRDIYVADFTQVADLSQVSHELTANASSGMPVLDQLHHDLFNAIDEMSCCTDTNFGTKYANFVGRIEQAFREEEAWMEGLDTPSLPSHQEEHARLLGALHNVHAQVMFGDITLGRQVVNELLPQWLMFHMSTMDTSVACAIQLAHSEAEALQPS